MAKFQRALVTGGAGFIGSQLADALIRRRIKVFVVDDLSTGRKENLNPNATFAKLSVASPAFPQFIRQAKPDIIFHHAAQINVRQSVADPLTDAKVNILGTLLLIQAAKEVGTKKIVFASSGGVMYPDAIRPPYRETVAADPISPYGISKRTGEMYLAFARAVHGIDTVALRYANVYGPRQNAAGEAGVVAIFADRMLQGKPAVINGAGTQTRDFLFVDDVVQANLLTMQKKVHGVYNIGTGRETNINTLFRKLKKMTGYELPERHGPAMPGEVMRSALDSRRAGKELGWQAQTGLEEGLKKTVEWFRKRN